MHKFCQELFQANRKKSLLMLCCRTTEVEISLLYGQEKVFYDLITLYNPFKNLADPSISMLEIFPKPPSMPLTDGSTLLQ